MSSRIAIFAALGFSFNKLSYHIIVLWNGIADPKEIMEPEDCRDSFDDEPRAWALDWGQNGGDLANCALGRAFWAEAHGFLLMSPLILIRNHVTIVLGLFSLQFYKRNLPLSQNFGYICIVILQTYCTYVTLMR
jgi:hypothetical protein